MSDQQPSYQPQQPNQQDASQQSSYQQQPYQPYGAPQQPYYPGTGGVPGGVALPPNKNIGWAIASLILCWPFCIPAFIASSKVTDLWYAGRTQEALHESAEAKKWGRIGVIVGACLHGIIIVLLIIYVIVIIVFASSVTMNS